jgi:glycosyltransferase involved in cell wall biosynthesis
VHTHSSKAGILGREAAFRSRVPAIIHTVHGMIFNRTQPWLDRRLYAWLERRAARRCHAIAAVSEAMIEQMAASRICRRGKLQLIYSGMDLEPFDPALYDRAAIRTRWGAGESDIVVGTVARLFRNKGYEQLIPIMDAAARRVPRLRFVWIGDGADRAAYEAELARRGLSGRTTLTGLVDPADIPELLSGVDIVAHASQWEGLPRVAVQALLMMVPVVAFAIDGTPEVVLDGVTGRCVPLNDEVAFSDALVELAGAADRRAQLGAAGREHCLPRFDYRVMIDQWE